MCLAVPGKVIKREGDCAQVDLQGNRLSVSVALVPQSRPGDWVLVHAGFAIQAMDEKEALETFELLGAIEKSA